MKTLFNRLAGFLLLIAAMGGLVFSAAGIYGAWTYKQQVSDNLVQSLDLLTASLQTTAQGLVIIEQSFGAVMGSVISVQDTLMTTVDTIETTKPMMSSLTDLLDEDLPGTITAVQTSLDTAYESAKIIDAVLRALTIFNRESYNPSVPLHEALQQISTSMDALPASFAEMEDSLRNTSSQTEIIQADLITVAASISEIEKALDAYETVIQDYQDSVREIKKQINTLKRRIPKAVNLGVWALTAFLAWMAIAQIGLLTQGWELLHRKANAPEPKPEVQTDDNPDEAEDQ
jgi:chromosome segregation ATPase